ncbi:MAG: C39 family peptidase [Candidatus Levybacteria bacterium]|nr:C39 family peptidase [Candidatus Levybacteria bacterium]
MKKIIFQLFLFALSLLFIFKSQASASTIIFQDNFNNGTATQWTPTNGPNLWRVENDKYGTIIVNGGTIIETTAGSIPTPNYIIEFDMYPIQGEDKNIYFRGRNNIANYGIHFNNSIYFRAPGAMFSKSGPTQREWPKIAPYFFQNNQPYHIKIILEGQHIQFFINDNKLFDEIDPDYQFTVNEQVILIMSTGSVYPTEIWFDNVVVRSINNDLEVLKLKQTWDPWGTLVYNSANVWSPLKPTISDWGCALTSAAMILQYHGINKLPDYQPLDPRTLNDWLKNEKDGYVGDGFVNWLAISRLSKLAKEANGITSFDALEFSRVNGSDSGQLTTDLNNLQPDILEEPGHFIVAKGINGDTFNINDPYYDRLTLNDSYSNTFLSLGRYVPSSTNLSYIMMTANQGIDIELKNSLGNSVGAQFLQQGLINESDGALKGKPLKFLYFPKPPSGNYKVFLKAAKTQEYNLGIFLYDINGEVNKIDYYGMVGPKTFDSFDTNFNQDDQSKSDAYKIITFQSTIDDINEARSLNLITNKFLPKILIRIIKTAQKDAIKGRRFAALLDLKGFEIAIKETKGKGIKEKAYQILLTDVAYLKSHL